MTVVDRQTDRVSAFAAALFSYKFFVRRFWSVVRLLALPIVAAGLVLYVCMSLYLSELLQFLGAPNPRVASFALGILAAGIFLSLFCYAIAVVAITNLALGKVEPGAWFHFRAERQVWRVYAAYMRFLLLLSLVFISVYLFSAYVAPLLPVARNSMRWALTILSVLAVYCLTARVGFLIAPVVAAGEGPVLRRAWQQSASDFWRNCGLIILLIVPGLLVQVAGEYVLQFGAWAPAWPANLSFAAYTRVMGEMLGSFLVVVSLSSFVTIVLLTVGAVAVYQNRRLPDAPEALRNGPARPLAWAILFRPKDLKNKRRRFWMNVLAAAPNIATRPVLPKLIVEIPPQHLHRAMLDDVAGWDARAQDFDAVVAHVLQRTLCCGAKNTQIGKIQRELLRR